jgi:hypothetical protein
MQEKGRQVPGWPTYSAQGPATGTGLPQLGRPWDTGWPGPTGRQRDLGRSARGEAAWLGRPERAGFALARQSRAPGEVEATSNRGTAAMTRVNRGHDRFACARGSTMAPSPRGG